MKKTTLIIILISSLFLIKCGGTSKSPDEDLSTIYFTEDENTGRVFVKLNLADDVGVDAFIARLMYGDIEESNVRLVYGETGLDFELAGIAFNKEYNIEVDAYENGSIRYQGTSDLFELTEEAPEQDLTIELEELLSDPEIEHDLTDGSANVSLTLNHAPQMTITLSEESYDVIVPHTGFSFSDGETIDLSDSGIVIKGVSLVDGEELDIGVIITDEDEDEITCTAMFDRDEELEGRCEQSGDNAECDYSFTARAADHGKPIIIETTDGDLSVRVVLWISISEGETFEEVWQSVQNPGSGGTEEVEEQVEEEVVEEEEAETEIEELELPGTGEIGEGSFSVIRI